MTEAAPTWEDAVRWLRGQPDQAKLVHDAYYDDPLPAAAERYWRSEEWADARRVLGRGPGRVLDVGAGRGIASYALARDGFSVTAVEPDSSHLVGAPAIRGLALETGLPIAVIETAAIPLPLPDAGFDLVFCRAVLHHLPDLPAALADYRRLLRPGGRLVAIREHVISRETDLPAFFDVHPLHHRYGGEMAYPLRVYLDAIRAAGFGRVTIINPLARPMNFAPYTREQLVRAIAGRAGRVPILPRVLERLLRSPLTGDPLLCLFGAVDRRPGRLYSFVAERDA